MAPGLTKAAPVSRGVPPSIRRCPTCGGRYPTLKGREARRIRVGAALTQAELAAQCGRTDGYIDKLENEHIPMSRFMAQVYQELARAGGRRRA